MKIAIAAVALLAPMPAAAEVVSSGEHGFELRRSAKVPSPPADAMRDFATPAGWWDSAHSYSGDSANLSMTLQPGGCFCERLPGGGGVEHMRVAYVDPGKRLVLTGSLGPLLYAATAGVMDLQFKPAGQGTEIVLTYKVAGFAGGGAAKLAPMVDGMIGQAVEHYRVFASKPR